MPTFYPTSAVSGGLSVKNAGVCSSYPNAVITPVIRLVPQYPQGVTPICTSNLTTSTYSCNIGYNNRIASPPPLSQSFTLSSTTQSYGTGRWQVNNLCAGGNDSVRTITAGNVKTGWDIFYKILPWFKVQNGSFVSDSLYFSIPNTVTKFDSDDLGNRYLLDGETGVLTTTMVALPSPSLLPVSNKNWSRANYTRISTITANNFINYIKSRKKYKTIISLSDIAADGIYYYNGNLSISSSSLVPDYNIVLLVKGSATITANLTQTTAFALLATNEILIDPAVTQINGIFSATSFDSGGSTSGLKVVGNISATTLNNDRDRTDNSKPSIFILFDSGTYLKLLPYLSVSKYDWRQLQ